MLESDIGELTFWIRWLEERGRYWEWQEVEGEIEADDRTLLISAFERAMDICKDAGLGGCLPTIKSAIGWITEIRPKYSSAPSEIRHVLDSIENELQLRRFFLISSVNEKYFDRANLFGKQVSEAFPSAEGDIREAGSCLAVDRNSAAVFHLMRATEWGLRALGVHLGFSRMKAKIKKSGKAIYAPIEYLEWEKILDQLQDRVDKKMQGLKKGPKKQEIQEFYYPALQDIRAIRDAWRNHLMHTRMECSKEDADAVLSHVRRLLITLAGKVKEV